MNSCSLVPTLTHTTHKHTLTHTQHPHTYSAHSHTLSTHTHTQHTHMHTPHTHTHTYTTHAQTYTHVHTRKYCTHIHTHPHIRICTHTSGGCMGSSLGSVVELIKNLRYFQPIISSAAVTSVEGNIERSVTN